MKTIIILLILVWSIVSVPCSSQWITNGAVVFDSSNTGTDEQLPEPAADGYGGLYVTWADWCAGRDDYDIYMQRLDSNGYRKWCPEGIPVCVAHGSQDAPSIAANGNKGVFVAWLDSRSSTGMYIYAQYITPDGMEQWTTGGIGVSEQIALRPPIMVSDGVGGVFISWYSALPVLYSPGVLYVQHLDSQGAMRWGTAGIRLREDPFEIDRYGNFIGSKYCSLRPDGVGGVYVAWSDLIRSAMPGISTFNLPYAQHLSATGEKLWKANGVLLNDSALTVNTGLEILPLKTDGTITFMWTKEINEYHEGTMCDYSHAEYMQRLNAEGEKIFEKKGKWWGWVKSRGRSDYVPDGKGGLLLAMSCDWHVRVARMDSTGQPVWSEFPRADMGSPAGVFDGPVSVSDGEGGIMMFWISTDIGYMGINYQHIDSAGQRRAGERPQVFYNLRGSSAHIRCVEASPGVALVTWNDNRRSTKNWSIHAAKLTRDGLTDVTGLESSSIPEHLSTYPNPARASVSIEFDAKLPGTYSCIVLDILGRRVQHELHEWSARGRTLWNIDTSLYEPGTYLYRIEGGSDVVVGRFILAGK